MNLTRPLRRRGLATLAIAFVLAFALSQLRTDSSAPANDPVLVPGQAGLRAVIDPETGQLATGTEASRLLSDKARDEELSTMLSRSSKGLVPVVHPDGRVSVDLQGRFMNVSVARIGQSGEVEQICVENAEEARIFLSGEDYPAEIDTSGSEVR